MVCTRTFEELNRDTLKDPSDVDVDKSHLHHLSAWSNY
jgi:hypothetical protein